MFRKFSSTPTDNQASQPSVQVQPSQVVASPQQPIQPVQTTPPEPMATSIPQAASAIKKGKKGSRAQPLSSPPPPLTQPKSQSESPLQRLEKGDYGLVGGSSYLSTSQVDESEPENLAPLPRQTSKPS